MESTQGNPAAAAPPPAAPGERSLSPVEAVLAGWRAFLANPWMSLGALLVLAVLLAAGHRIPLVGLFFMILVAPSLYAGGARFFLRGIRGENPPFECAFEGFQRWPSVTGAALIVNLVSFLIMTPMLFALVGAIGFAALLSLETGHFPQVVLATLLPFFALATITGPVLLWWAIRSYLVFFTVMDADRPTAIEAVRRSLALTKGSFWRLAGLFLLWIPLWVVGLAALCVGIVPAVVVQCYSLAHAYEQLRARGR
jgi:uncharacterized membrane protein